MRRPLCIFYLGMLGLELICAFLPQAGALLPLAAFFAAGLLWLWRGGASRSYGVCLILGALLGVGTVAYTNARIARIQEAYAGQEVWLTAEVESAQSSYYPGVVDAVLRVEAVGGVQTDFRIEVVCLPQCAAGERIGGRFALEEIDASGRLSSLGDGVVLNGELLEHFICFGQSKSFRAETARLQAKLSAALCDGMPQEPAGALAAMVLGDRSKLSRELNTAYRGAGLSHVLVVSGMHVTILCGGAFRSSRRREQSRMARRLAALYRALLALLLVGITGFGPSVLRAAVAVWVASLGVWVGGAPDALTSLAAAGAVMTLGNSYAACDVGFELSFAAVAGTLAGAELARCGRKKLHPKENAADRSGWKKYAASFAANLLETVCISFCASAATFPVLVLRGLSVSLYALLSSVAVLWMVEPILLLGLAAALLSVWPIPNPAQPLVSMGAAFLTGLLDGWAQMVSGWPGAQLWFDTAYAALVCLLLLGLGWLAFRWRVRLRLALPGLLLAALVSIGVGNALNRDVVRVELAGSSNAPAVVITKGERAAVLYRGGDSTRQAVERALTRRGIRTAELVVDLRMDPETPCGLAAEQTIATAKMNRYQERRVFCGPTEVELMRTNGGCVARVTVAGRRMIALSGNVRLAQKLQADWLLASPSDPGAVRYQKCLALGQNYAWMEAAPPEQVSRSLALRPGGGVREE